MYPIRALVVFCLLASPVLAAEPTAAQKLGRMLADPDKDACISLTTESELWRDATAADYTSSGWVAWRKYTRSETPWQAKGDFDGDGLQDVAKVIVDKAGKRWMMGVMFGHADGAPCHRYQISGKDLATMPIAGVLTLPKGKDSLTCHHMGEQGPVTCKLGAEGGPRNTDTLLTFDDLPSYSAAYQWVPNTDPTRDSRGQFDRKGLTLENDFAGMAAHSQADAKASHAGDGVNPTERAALVQEFEQAWMALEKTRNYRVITRSEMRGGQVDGNVTRTVVEYVDATHSRTTIESSGTKVVFLRSGSKFWNSTDGTTWTALPDDDGSAAMPMVSPIGDAAIKTVRADTRAGRAVKVMELSGQGDATLVLDVARQRPLQRIDTLPMGAVTTVTQTDYEYDISVQITPPTAP
ncbi:hypothetical protein [Tahibacter amnicola]|uniref:VCBS repeat protein n=1 Tax=Tahibacter amnicola TaxID=2976241 RepID=A0ABY6BCP7_9GAMM|nr:hypothetical protein [Tahibacter amnicola]UXI66890.1 hypothetical protein N4264_19335 [Tahibacter amnicola]